MVEFFTSGVVPPVAANAQLVVNLWDVNTDLGFFAQTMNPAAGTMVAPVHAFRRIVPTIGSHNYNLRGWVSSGSGSIRGGTGGPGAFLPGFLRVTKA